GTAVAQAVGMTPDGSTSGITSVLVFGAGTNYALLLISRYREELGRNENHREALGIAVRQAGPAILASNATGVLAPLTLLFADLGTAVAQAVGMTPDGSTSGITSVLVFGAGTNYALLLISRYREELGRNENHREALGIAVRQAGPAILASNATVVLALLTLIF